MRVWTVQPKEIWDVVKNTGVYTCDETKSEWLKEGDRSREAYKWLSKRMTEKIGNPKNIAFPVWAWYKWDWKNEVTDFFEDYFKGETPRDLVLIELELPESEIVLTDEPTWVLVMNQGFVNNSLSDEEFDEIRDWYNKLPYWEKPIEDEKSWEYVFDIEPFENDFATQGRFVQATFWELKLENVVKVEYFRR
jgi:hypothetical protein